MSAISLSKNYNLGNPEAPKTEVSEKPHALVTTDPVAQAKVHAHWKAAYKLAAIVATVACVFFGTFAIIFTSVYAPIHLPLALILLTIPGLPVSASYIGKLWDKSRSHESDLKRCNWVIERMAKIEDPIAECKALGVEPHDHYSKIVDIGRGYDLKHVLAQYFYLKDLQEKGLELAKKCFNNHEIELDLGSSVSAEERIVKLNPSEYKISKIDLKNPVEKIKFQKFLDSKNDHQMYLRAVANINLKLAECLKLIENPYAKKREFQDLSNFDVDIRLGATHNDPLFDAYLKTDDGVYSTKTIAKADIHALAEVFYGLKPRGGKKPKSSGWRIFG